MINKRGDASNSAGNVAVLISLIALFIIIYILVLPQQDREELLFGEDGIAINGNKIDQKVLLEEFIGKVTVQENKATRKIHDISDVNLFTKQEAGLTTLSNNLIVSKSFFSSNPQYVSFNVDNPFYILIT